MKIRKCNKSLNQNKWVRFISLLNTPSTKSVPLLLLRATLSGESLSDPCARWKVSWNTHYGHLAATTALWILKTLPLSSIIAQSENSPVCLNSVRFDQNWLFEIEVIAFFLKWSTPTDKFLLSILLTSAVSPIFTAFINTYSRAWVLRKKSS